MKKKVVAIIPAYKEQELETLPPLFQDLLDQSYGLEKIILVDDASKDAIISEIGKKHGVTVYRNSVSRMRAGAVNRGLAELNEDIDFVLILDADTRVKRDLVGRALSFFQRHPRCGGVCSISGVLPIAKDASLWKKYLWKMQHLEYEGFNQTRTGTWKNVMVLHGMCTMFRRSVLEEVGRYTLDHLIEDYDLTIKIKKAGHLAMFNPEMKAWTVVPTSLEALIAQRLRWLRGGIDVLLEHGISRFTWEDAINHVLFWLLLLAVIVVITSHIILGNFTIKGVMWEPIALILAILGYARSIWGLKYVEDLSWIDILIRISILPELFWASIFTPVQIWAYILALSKKKQSW